MHLRDHILFGGGIVLTGIVPRRQLVDAISASGAAGDGALTTQTIAASLDLRESHGSSQLVPLVSIPHAIVAGATRFQVIPCLAVETVVMNPVSGPITLFIAIIGPSSEPWRHIQLLARLTRILKDPQSISNLFACRSPDELESCLRTEDSRHD